MLKTRKYPKWRPDKVITHQDYKHWKPVNGHIVGKFALPSYVEKGEDANSITEDDWVRTPSDHMSVMVDFEF